MLNLGGLFFTLDADTRGLMQAQRRVERFATDVRKAYQGVNRGTVAPQFAAGLARQERAVVASLERIKKLQDQIGSSPGAGSSGISGKAWQQARQQLELLSNQYNNFTRKMAAGVPLNTLDFGRRVQHMRSQIDETTRSLNRLQREAMNTGRGMSGAASFMQAFGSSALVVQGHFGGLSTRLFAFSTLVKEVGFTVAATTSVLAGMGAGVLLLGTQAVQAGRALERLEVGFKALTGSAGAGGTHIEYVKDVAAQAGLIFEDTAKAYQRFLASAKGNLDLKTTQDTFRGISLAAATMQLSVEDTQGVFRALDQMMSKGTVQAEELRGQLGDRLPGAFKIAAAAMGVTTRQLGEMMKKGDVISSEFVPKFTKTLMAMWGIDPSKNIDTLQASLNNLSNSWTYFAQDLDKATGASRVFKNMVDSLKEGLDSIRGNIPEVAGAIGALTGALIGLGAAWAVTTLLTYISGLGGFVAIAMRAVAALRALYMGQVLFNSAIGANIYIKAAQVLLTFTAAIYGAQKGYELFNKAVSDNAKEMADTSAIQSYIDAQKAAGFQVAETTNRIREQMRAMQAQSHMQLMDNVNRMRDAQKNYQKAQEYTKSLTQGTSGSGLLVGGVVQGINKAILGKRESELRDATEAVKNSTKSMRQFQSMWGEYNEVAALPFETIASHVGTGSGADGAAGKMSDAIDKFEDLILKMKEAEALLAAMGNNPGARKLIEDSFEAQRALNNIADNPKALAKLQEALNAEGIEGEGLLGKLTNVVTRTREANEAVSAYNSVLDDLDKESRMLGAFNAQVEHLLRGGDPEGLDFYRDLADALESIQGIDPTTAGGMKALMQIQERLRGLGIEVKNTGDAFADTGRALGTFFNQTSRTKDSVKAWERLVVAIRNAQDELADIQSTTVGYNTQDMGPVGRIFAADIGDETRAAIERGRKVEDYRRTLMALTNDQAEVNRKTAEYLELLRQIDDARFAMERIQKAAEANREAMRSMVSDTVMGFKDIITGVKSVGDALRDLANNILDSLWKRFVLAPLDNLIQDIGRNQAKKATAGLDTIAAGLPANDNGNTSGVAQINALGAAAQATANTMQGSLIGSIAGLVAQTIAGTTTEAASTATTAARTAMETTVVAQMMQSVAALIFFRMGLQLATQALIALAASSGEGEGGGGIAGAVGKGIGSIVKGLAAGAEKRALGGPMSVGTLYEINEPGVAGEYFIPSVHGAMSNKAPANDSGPSIVIDARTTIDARGASPDAIKLLRAEMAQRDQSLRKELPYMMDARVRQSSSRGRYG